MDKLAHVMKPRTCLVCEQNFLASSRGLRSHARLCALCARSGLHFPTDTLECHPTAQKTEPTPRILTFGQATEGGL